MEKLQSLLNDLLIWSEQFKTPEFWAQFIVFGFAVLLGRTLHPRLVKYLQQIPVFIEPKGVWEIVWLSIERILTPILILIILFAGRAVLNSTEFAVTLLNLAAPLVLSYVLIRLSVYWLRLGIPPSPALKAWEKLISTSIWVLVALHLVGWLDGILNTMDALAFHLGESRISLLSVIKLLLMIAVFFIVALWLIKLIERKVMGSKHLDVSLKVGLVKVSRFGLITMAFILALSAVGIDLTALTVFGGALGVGLGFGLQRIASNFISGFILIMDRSIRPGDVITIGDQFGWVEELRARYIVVRNREGVETLIPNENLIISEVINWSYSDRVVRLRLPVQISYDDDPEQAMALMTEAAFVEPRVLKDPLPTVRLLGFGNNGIDLELRVWINDPQNGLGTVRSSVNLAIWKTFKQAGITIPFPQRDLNIRNVADSVVQRLGKTE